MPGGLHPPLEVISKWHFNYANPDTSGFYIVVLVGVLLGLSYLAVIFRLVSRLHFQKSFGIDDGLIVFNMIPLTGMAAAVILAMTRYGLNKHVWEAETPVLIQARQVVLAIEMLYMISTCTTKVSILLFYRRLATDTVSLRFLYFVYAAIAYVAIYFCIWFFALFGICRPLSTYWKMADWAWYAQNEGSIQCLPEGNMLIASAAISASQDFIACGLPTILLWKLQMPRRTKVGLCCLFAVGFFLSVCAVLRTVYIYRVYYDTYDMTYGGQPALLWLTIEAELAIVCASVPALRKFLLQVSGVVSTRRSTAHTTGEKAQSPGDLHGPERKTSAHSLGRRNASFSTERSVGSDGEFVRYEHSRTVMQTSRGPTFYEEETIDVP